MPGKHMNLEVVRAAAEIAPDAIRMLQYHLPHLDNERARLALVAYEIVNHCRCLLNEETAIQVGEQIRLSYTAMSGPEFQETFGEFSSLVGLGIAYGKRIGVAGVMPFHLLGLQVDFVHFLAEVKAFLALNDLDDTDEDLVKRTGEPISELTQSVLTRLLVIRRDNSVLSESAKNRSQS